MNSLTTIRSLPIRMGDNLKQIWTQKFHIGWPVAFSCISHALLGESLWLSHIMLIRVKRQLLMSNRHSNSKLFMSGRFQLSTQSVLINERIMLPWQTNSFSTIVRLLKFRRRRHYPASWAYRHGTTVYLALFTVNTKKFWVLPWIWIQIKLSPLIKIKSVRES